MNIEEKIQSDVNLGEYTTFKIGGKAKFFVAIANEDELTAAIRWAGDKNEKIYVLGGGSNLLVSDSGVSGLVIKPENNEISVKGERIEVGAGASLASVVLAATKSSLTGMEWAVGVPGTVGGAVRGNAGCFGSAIDQVIETIKIFDVKKQTHTLFSNRDCHFSYRSSAIKLNTDLIVLNATIKLNPGRLADINERLSFVVNKRKAAYPKLPSAGSVFKNLDLDAIKRSNPGMGKRFDEMGIARDNQVASHWLIREAGLQGKVIGGAKVSLEHANFIVNTGKATAQDVIELIELVKLEIMKIYNLKLEEEIVFFGF